MLYVSTGAFHARDLATIIAVARDTGVRGIELASGFRLEQSDRERLHAHEMAWLVHNYVPAPANPFVLNLASADPLTQRRSAELATDAIRLAAEIGAPFYSVHSGFVAELTPDDLGRAGDASARFVADAAARTAALERFEAVVLPLADEAEDAGLRLLLENNVAETEAAAAALLNVTASDIMAFVARVDHPRVGLLLDLGHLRVSANVLGFDPHEFVEEVAPLVGCLHLSENDGTRDQNLPFDERAWFWDHLERFRHVPWVVEAYRLDEATLARQVALLEEALGPADV
jgi:sugar phosphate isomerase/epimerase